MDPINIFEIYPTTYWNNLINLSPDVDFAGETETWSLATLLKTLPLYVGKYVAL